MICQTNMQSNTQMPVILRRCVTAWNIASAFQGHSRSLEHTPINCMATYDFLLVTYSNCGPVSR